MLQFQQVETRYPDGTRVTLPDWKVADGEHWLVLGPSGSGKTTLLHLAAGLQRPSGGRITLDGTHLGELSPRALDRFRAPRVGLVHQTLHLIDALSVRQNLALAQYLAGQPVDGGRIEELLEDVGLAELAGKRPTQLSQGQAQRVAIARAVINRPALILADEPTSALDDTNCRRMHELLSRQAGACGAALVIATHDNRLTDRVTHRLTLGGSAA